MKAPTLPLALFLLAAWLPTADAQSPAASKSTATPEAEPATAKAVKLVRLSGVYADLPEQTLDLGAVLGGGGGQPKAFYTLIDRLQATAADADSDTVLFDLSRGFALNLPQTVEVSRSVARLRAAGKRCVAYIEAAGRAQYAIASQCDEVLMADMGMLDFGALAMSTMFLRDALDLMGVKMDVIRCGDFKGAVEPYLLPRMSKHLRAHYLDMLGTMNDALVEDVARGRGLEPKRVREAQRQRLLSADDALRRGLVDRVVPWTGAERALETFLAQEVDLDDALGRKKKRRSFNLMAMMQNLMKPTDEVEVDEDRTIAVLHLSGAIVDGHKPQAGSIVSGPTVGTIRGIRDNANISGVVVRINSPGGSATASEAILLALAELADSKPVVCSMGNLAASGGYYITCFGRPILAEAGTITGSIGVFGMKPELGALMRRVGVHVELVGLDEAASLDALDQPWTDAQRAQMQRMIDGVYDRFLGHVAKSRELPRETVEAIAGGRVWSGQQAVDRKLVDRIGGLEDALTLVVEQAGLQRDEVEIVHLPQPRSAFETLAAQMMDVRALGIDLGPALLQRLRGLESLWTVLHRSLTAPQPGQAWMVLPVALDVR